MAMQQEFPEVNQDRTISPHAQEIECALILQRMIDKVKNDPTQMRLAIYEFARARLKIDTSLLEESERKRLTEALETAIQGVEEFSLRTEERALLQSPTSSAQNGLATASTQPLSTSVARAGPITPAAEDIIVPDGTYSHPELQVVEVRSRGLLSTLASLGVGMLLFGVVAGLAYYRERLPLLGERPILPQLNSVAKQAAVPDAAPQTSAPAAVNPASGSSNSPGFPLPTDYGIYALSNGALSELYLLPERVPDRRIAMSTPVTQPSRTTLSNGKARFILFRRELVGNAPERVDVRVVARVVRALTFDAKGKPSFSPISDAWNIRNISYEFRVRPIAGNPEMLLVQSEKADFTLPPGRYVLVLRDQGYDFTVAGNVTELAQCLERTDAANGSFYSECNKP